MNYSLAMTTNQYDELRSHLLPKDGKEAVAIIFCSPCQGKDFFKFIASKIVPVPYEDCTIRTANYVRWNFGKFFPPKELEYLDQNNLSILTVHSHPGGFDEFSELDDDDDEKKFSSINAWFDDNRPNGALIFLDDGRIIGRVINHQGDFIPMNKISVVGDCINIQSSTKEVASEAYSMRIEQVFGKGTLNTLRKLKVAIVGCSGTGSIVAELLARNCVGELLLIDKDVIEEKNLNRIVNSQKEDAQCGRTKVIVLKRAIEKMGMGTKVSYLESATYEPGTLHKLKECDVIFGCVDGAEGRYHLDILSCCYLTPYFDVGVNLDVTDSGVINQALAKVRYISPQGPYLLDMKGYRPEQVKAEESKRVNPRQYEKNRMARYLESVKEDQPAVISINMLSACLSVNDFLARLHNYRFDSNSEFIEQNFSLTDGHYQLTPQKPNKTSFFNKHFAKGDRSDLMLNW